MAKGKRRRGRPPGGGEEIVSAILRATLEDLGAHGLAGLSFERVADAAGVNKTSVYRRWPTKIELVLASVQLLREEPPRIDAADLRGSLITLLTAKARVLSEERGRRIGRALFLLDTEDPAAAAEARDLRRRGQAPITALVEAAVERGELPAQTDAELATDLLVAPLLYRVLLLGETVRGTDVAAMVDATLLGLRSRDEP